MRCPRCGHKLVRIGIINADGTLVIEREHNRVRRILHKLQHRAETRKEEEQPAEKSTALKLNG